MFVYLTADISAQSNTNLTLPLSTTQGSAIYERVRQVNCMPQTALDG